MKLSKFSSVYCFYITKNTLPPLASIKQPSIFISDSHRVVCLLDFSVIVFQI